MNKLSSRFYITNAIACIWLIYNGATIQEEHEKLMSTQDLAYGIFLYLLVIPGIYFSYIKAKDLRYNQKHPLNVFEGIFIVLIYIFALLSNSLIVFFASSFIFGGADNIPEWFNAFNIVINLAAVGYIFTEGYVLSNDVENAPSPNLVNLSNYILPVYTGVAISLTWNVFMLGGNIRLDPDQSDIVSETIAACVLVLMILLPFQRLLWYEIFADSRGWKANLKIVGSLIFVILSAILPLFF